MYATAESNYAHIESDHGGGHNVTFVIGHETALSVKNLGISVGGAGVVVEKQAEALKNLGLAVSIVSPHPNGGANGFPYDQSTHKFFIKPPLDNNALTAELLRSDSPTREEIKQQLAESGNIIYAHYPVAGALMAELRDELPHKPALVYMGHSWDRVAREDDPTRTIVPVREHAELTILAKADRIIVATHAEREALARMYGQDVPGGISTILEKTYVVPLGVNQEEFSPQAVTAEGKREMRARHLPGLEGTLNFYSLGRISPQKGQLQAIQAFCKAAGELPNISLSIIGGPLEGAYFERIQSFLASQPDDIKRRIVFHGAKPAVVAHTIGDVFVGPSTWETWFLALTEAMGRGNATIVSDKPILREVAGDGTMFVSDNDTNQLAEAIRYFATNPFARAQSGRYNSIKAANYTWETSAMHLQQVFDTIN